MMKKRISAEKVRLIKRVIMVMENNILKGGAVVSS